MATKPHKKILFPSELLRRYPRPIPVSENMINEITIKIKRICIKHTFSFENIYIHTSPSVISVDIYIEEKYIDINTQKAEIKDILKWMSKLREFRLTCLQEFKDFGKVRVRDNYPYNGHVIVEIPRPDRQLVSLIEMMDSSVFKYFKADIPFVLGISTENTKVATTLQHNPNLLIAGEENTGKTILLHSLIVSMLCVVPTKDLKFILIDTLTKELAIYNKIGKQYLTTNEDTTPQVITSRAHAMEILEALCIEMNKRFISLKKTDLSNIEEYNDKLAIGHLPLNQNHKHLPKLVVIIKEYADLMVRFGERFEKSLHNLAKNGSKVGIHLIISTQQISTEIITHKIKASFSSRISFKVGKAKESKLIIDEDGAQLLPPKGDMLWLRRENILRIQGCFISDQEIAKVCEWIAENKKERYYPYFLPKTPNQLEHAISQSNVSDDSVVQPIPYFIEESGYNHTLLKQHCRIGTRLVGTSSTVTDNPEINDESISLRQKILRGLKRLKSLLPFTSSNKDTSDDEYSNEKFYFPYSRYEIIGNKKEIEYILSSPSIINITIEHVTSILSLTAPNYIVVGYGSGVDRLDRAFFSAIEELQEKPAVFSKLLLFLSCSPHKPISVEDINKLTINIIRTDFNGELVWGLGTDPDLKDEVKICIIATTD